MISVTVTRHETAEPEQRPYLDNDVLGTFAVPDLDEVAMRAAMARCIASGRVGKRRNDVEDIARILVEHGANGGSTGGQRIWQAAHDGIAQVIAARAQCEAVDAPLRARWEQTGVSHERLQAIDRAYEHGWAGLPSREEGEAFGVNVSRHAVHGRLWWIEEQAWAALSKAWTSRIEAIAREEAAALLDYRAAV